MKAAANLFLGILLSGSLSFADENVGQQISKIETKNSYRDSVNIKVSQETLYRNKLGLWAEPQNTTRYNVGYSFILPKSLDFNIGVEYVAKEFGSEKVVGISHIDLALKKIIQSSDLGVQATYGLESKIALATSSEPEQWGDSSVATVTNNALGYSQISPYVGLVYKVRAATIAARYIYSIDTELQRNTSASIDYRFSYNEHHLEAYFELDVIKNLSMGVLGSTGNGNMSLDSVTRTNNGTESFSKLYASYKVDPLTQISLSLYSVNESIPDQFHSSGVGLNLSRQIE